MGPLQPIFAIIWAVLTESGAVVDLGRLLIRAVLTGKPETANVKQTLVFYQIRIWQMYMYAAGEAKRITCIYWN